MIKFNSNIILNGFSEAIVDCNNYILSNNFLKRVFSQFFTKFIILSNRKYFLLLRLQYSNGSIKTLHKGLVVSSESLDDYIKYCNDILSLKSNNY